MLQPRAEALKPHNLRQKVEIPILSDPVNLSEIVLQSERLLIEYHENDILFLFLKN